MEWTEEETQTLKKLWGTGISARQIAVEIGRTRGAIIGRANRIGLAKHKTKKPALILVEAAPPAKAAGCQFPLGDYPYHSCGEAVSTAPNQSTNVYCAAHYKRCYRQRLGVTDKFKVEGKGRIYPRPVVGWGSHMTSVL
jgi:hypothetical protein